MTQKVSSWPSLVIHIKPVDRDALKHQAEQKGLQLIPYCRMVLLENLAKHS